MTYESFLGFIHPVLREAFLVTHENVNYEGTLQSSLTLATNEYNQFKLTMDLESVTITFDSELYILKRALCHVYSFVIQDVAFLKNIQLTGLGVDESDVFKHFNSLKEQEELDVAEMRNETMAEYRKSKGIDGGSTGSGARVTRVARKNAYGVNRSRRY